MPGHNRQGAAGTTLFREVPNHRLGRLLRQNDGRPPPAGPAATDEIAHAGAPSAPAIDTVILLRTQQGSGSAKSHRSLDDRKLSPIPTLALPSTLALVIFWL